MKSKRKLISLIITAVIFIVGCVFLILGILNNGGNSEKLPSLNPFDISEKDAGKRFSGSVKADFMELEQDGDNTKYILFICDDFSAEDAEEVIMVFDIPNKLSDKVSEAIESEGKLPFEFVGTLRKNDSAMTDKAVKKIYDYFKWIDEISDGEDINISEEAVRENFEQYYVDVEETSGTKTFIIIGSVIIAVALIVLLTTLFGKKVPIILVILLAIAIIVVIVLNIGKIRTMASVTKVSDGFYKITCHYDYKCDDYLNSDINNLDDMIDWISEQYFFGIPIEPNKADFGCSAFAAKNPDGKHLFGRNFDYDETDALIVYTEPDDGYASMGMVDLEFFNVGEGNVLSADSIAAKGLMVAAPYVCLDGVNEKGLGTGILQLNIDEVHQDNGKKDMLIYTAIRGILDKCATVDEAIEFLSSYDIHTALNASYHLFIADKSGRSVVVEWAGNEMYVVEENGCTNSVLSTENKYYDPEDNCNRYDIIKARLENNNNILTDKEAMELAADVSHKRQTEWSCVFNLDDFSVDVCVDADYSKTYSFTKKDFK